MIMSKTLIITGGSRGIGQNTIALFKENGWTCINLSRSSSTIPDVINIHLDLSSSQEVAKKTDALQALVKNTAQICLVHNAAYYQPDEIPSLSIENLQRTLEINVISPALLNKIFIPYMRAGSSIIYIGSTLAEKAVPGSASYIASKHAVIGLMRATCQDLNGKEIHTCCICPGLVDTKLLRDTIDEKTIEYLIKNKIIGHRLIEPIEIAKTIYFCAISSIINGTVLHANLGQVAD